MTAVRSPPTEARNAETSGGSLAALFWVELPTPATDELLFAADGCVLPARITAQQNANSNTASVNTGRGRGWLSDVFIASLLRKSGRLEYRLQSGPWIY